MGFEISGPIGALALAVPFVALALTVALYVGFSRKHDRAEVQPQPVREPAPQPADVPRAAPATAPPAQHATGVTASQPPPAPSATRVAAPTPAPVPSAGAEKLEPAPKLATNLAAELAQAEAQNDQQRLAPLYVALAQQILKEGQNSQRAADLLRKAIWTASKLGQKETHALARVELGDIHREAGDLTTACEHWQLARSIYYELKQQKAHDATEARMLKHHCPTDWVLNDF